MTTKTKLPRKRISTIYQYRPAEKNPLPTDTDPTSTLTLTTTHFIQK